MNNEDFAMKSYLFLGFIFLSTLNLIGRISDPYSTCEDNRWHFRIAPYLWSANMVGEVSTLPPLPPVHVDISFSKILKRLDAAIMLAGEARKGDFSFFGNVMYVSLSDNVHFVGESFNEATLKTKYWISTVSAGYRFIDADCFSLTATLGGRFWNVKTALSVGGPAGARALESSELWLDPALGLRANFDLPCGFSIEGWGMIGGFDVSSKLFWDVFGAMGYSWNENWQVLLGYRYLSVDYRNEGFIFDVTQGGPIAALVISF